MAKRRRIEIVCELERTARFHRCDLWDTNNLKWLRMIKREIIKSHYCIGAPAYQELNRILDRCLEGINSPYLVEHRYLDLTQFFELDDEAKDVVFEYADDSFNLDDLRDEDIRDILRGMARHKPIWKYIQLLIGYPVWDPKGKLADAVTDPMFFKGREEDYNYELTVMGADIDTVRDAFNWIWTRSYNVYLS